jgi:hypothetical protein
MTRVKIIDILNGAERFPMDGPGAAVIMVKDGRVIPGARVE